MAEFALNKIGTLILIGIVLVLLMIGGGQLLWSAGKSGLKWVDSQLGFGLFKEEDLTGINENAQRNFDLLNSEIKFCENSKNKDCKCKSEKGFNDFREIHELQISNDKTKLVIIKDRNELTKSQSDITVKCYFKNGVNYLITPIKINFKDKAHLEDANGNDEDFIKQSKDILYKTSNGEICWLIGNLNKNYC